MSMQIKSILLYNQQGEIRQIDFKLGVVNLITGDSDTGKSAIIPIIDYCMGHSEFEVPTGVIREVVAWYAVLYQVGNKQALVAKPAPVKNSNRQHHAYYMVSNEVSIPSISQLVINSSDDDVIDQLSRLLRDSLSLSNLESSTAEELKTTIEYVGFYLFQKKNIIANNEELFYKQRDSTDKIKDTLAYFLGAEREDDLQLKYDSKQKRKELKRLKTQRSKEKDQLEYKEEKAKSLLIECQHLGLADKNLLVENTEQIRPVLEQVCRDWQVSEYPPVSDDLEPQWRTDLTQLRAELEEKFQEINSVESFVKDATGYSVTASDHRMRLESIKLFEDPQVDDLFQEICPLCSSSLSHPIPRISSMRHALKQLENNLTVVRHETATLNTVVDTLKQELEAIRVKLKEKNEALGKILREKRQKDSLVKKMMEQDRQVSMMVGRIKEYLEVTQLTGKDSNLRHRIATLEKIIKSEQAQLEDISSIFNSILDDISRDMTSWAKDLGLEYQGIYRLDQTKLTVSISESTRGKVPVLMKSMGGGLNWLGCHLVALLALHKHFILAQRPVPHFLILDQPIQGYLDRSKQEDADSVKIKRMLELVVRVCNELTPNLQIIVTEHNPSLDQEGFHRVEPHWTKEGKALIPIPWQLSVASTPSSYAVP
ncbi:MAG: hypothetical protein BWK78_06920 [Thiotrichaceae bacterium IS1]|nr:MAG: hypothetical protein BWK78_06920 [Thiotrichaceae bacterium IS1]